MMERSPIDLVDVLAFAWVVESGSFARAGDRLGVSKSIVSRRVARLEEKLGARLLTRSARGTEPTDIGSDYHRRLVAILGDLEAAHEAVAEATSEVAGTIRLTAPISFGVDHLSSVLAEFMTRHPRVELDVALEDRRVDLLAEHFDLAVRIGNLPDSSLIARKLAPVRAVMVASPAYLDARGRPSHPRELAKHDVLFYTNSNSTGEWRFRVDGRWERVRVAGRLRANNGDALREAARAGLGIALLPSFIASRGLIDGSLETVLGDCPLEEAGLYAIMPPGRATTARVRALVEHLARSFGPTPAWDPCARD
ncbi:LysR family transcriptional regulator [Sphingomonas oleivorans]|uniref:LysR family transcriptional regulator n=1 Tax=Sphingomonas oleivorans TaxID=1735121 RepID=A0A2T5FWZ4_9SPHN|nr:LysR family transcriptional regulator [Sphingomonas oleivorans]